MVERYTHPPGRLLDVGCASGRFLRRAIDAGWKGEGVEPCETLVRKARQVLGSEAQVHFATLQAAPIAKAAFDVVTLWDVLEHVTDPIGFLGLVSSLLKPGGLLFANVPNLDSIQARLLRSKWPLLLPEHLNYFNLNSLKKCSASSGLHWIDSCGRSAAFSLGYVFYRLRQHGVPGSSLAFRLVNKAGIRNLTIPVPLGEICGVWKR
jgi:SAM-dependent methyltransferase